MRAYRHRYKFNVKPPGWNVWVKIAVKKIVEVMKLVVEGDEGDERKIFRENPHSAWDNYFSGYQIVIWFRGNGFGATIPCSRRWIPG